MQQHFEIIGSGVYLPREVILSRDLDRKFGLEPGWTEQRTGVRQRHRRAPDEHATDMGKAAALAALADARITLAEIDLILDASTCQQQPLPCNAALLNQALGHEAAGIASMDIHGSCLSFIAALSVANGLFAAGMYRRALIVSAETPLNGVNWESPQSAGLMGDGAAAVVVQQIPAASPLSYRHQTLGEYADICRVSAGGHRIPPSAFTEDNQHTYQFYMDGPALHRVATRKLPHLVRDVVEQQGESLDQLHVIPHQASGPALRLLSRRLFLRPDRVYSSLWEHGNLVAAGIPFTLHHVRQRIPRDERVLLIGTAAGYAQAAMIFTL